MTNSLRKKTLHGMQWSVIGTIGSSILQMVVMVVITRIIAPEEFGVLAMAQIFMQFAALFSNFGIGPAILRKEQLTDDDMAVGFWCGMAISVIIASMMFLLAPYSTYLLDSPKIVIIVRLMSVNFLINGLRIVSFSQLQRQMRFGYLALVTMVSYVLGYGLVGIPLALKGYGAYALVYCMLTQTLIQFFAQFIAVRHRIVPPKKLRLYREMLSFGGQHSFAGFVSFLGSSIDRFVLGRWGGAETLGIYSRSAQLINQPMQLLSGSITRVLFPGFSSIQRDRQKMAEVYVKSFEIVAFVLIPIACVASLTSRDLLLLAYGQQWVSGWPALTVYSWVAPLTIFSMMNMMINDIIGRQAERILIHLTALPLFAICIWFGLPYGIKGVALGSLVGYSYRLIFTSKMVARLLKIQNIKLLQCLYWPMFFGCTISAIPLVILLFGSTLPVWLRLFICVMGAGLSSLLLIIFVQIPPLVHIINILEEGHPKLTPFLKWIKQN